MGAAGHLRAMPSSDLGARPLTARRDLRRLDALRSARVRPLLARLARSNRSRPRRIGAVLERLRRRPRNRSAVPAPQR
jgi:hypothetical protein